MNFTPSADVVSLLGALLDIYERRELARRDETVKRQVIRVKLDGALTPAYFSQTDPAPRLVTNTQLEQLERSGALNLDWLRGERGHLLASVALDIAQVDQAYTVLGRESLAAKRKKLLSLLVSERARFQTRSLAYAPSRAPFSPASPETHEGPETPETVSDWRIRALGTVIHRLREGKTQAPFSLTDAGVNDDVLAALRAVGDVHEETPHRVFSVRVFNDSKRFQQIAPKLAMLARRGNPHWRTFTRDEVLRELNLVANPNHLFLFGDWALVDGVGQAISLNAFTPSVGLPSVQAAGLKVATVAAERVICVENLTSFNELTRAVHQSGVSGPGACLAPASATLASICLMGNPSPACRHLLRLSGHVAALCVWADLDYGGFNILAQIRAQVSAAAQPIWMDIDTFDRFAKFARPFAPGDEQRLTRLLTHPLLGDVAPVIRHLLRSGLKLEQEAISLDMIQILKDVR